MIAAPSSAEAGGPVPPESPIAMPVQDFRTLPATRRLRRTESARVWLARLITFGGTAAIAVIGFMQMLEAFGDKPTPMQLALLALFVPTFAWVGFSFCGLLAGLFAPRLTTPDGPMMPASSW